MGVLKAIGDILFGKDPDIFDDKGQVLHRHPKKKWDQWQNRFRNDPDFNWRHHSGMGATPSASQIARQTKDEKRP